MIKLPKLKLKTYAPIAFAFSSMGNHVDATFIILILKAGLVRVLKLKLTITIQKLFGNKTINILSHGPTN